MEPQSNNDESCPSCRGPRVLDFSNGKELVCPKCGIATEVKDVYAYADIFYRAPSSSLLHGNIGTNYATRNPDGSSDSYDMHGNNGEYEHPVLTVVKPWYLQTIIEPNQEIRAAQERLSRTGLSNGNSEIDLSLEGEAIMAELKHHKKLKKSLLIDPEDPEYNDLIIEGKFTFRDWLEQLRGNLY